MPGSKVHAHKEDIMLKEWLLGTQEGEWYFWVVYHFLTHCVQLAGESWPVKIQHYPVLLQVSSEGCWSKTGCPLPPPNAESVLKAVSTVFPFAPAQRALEASRRPWKPPEGPGSPMELLLSDSAQNTRLHNVHKTLFSLGKCLGRFLSHE